MSINDAALKWTRPLFSDHSGYLWRDLEQMDEHKIERILLTLLASVEFIQCCVGSVCFSTVAQYVHSVLQISFCQ